MSIHERLEYATTEQEIRDAVIDYNGEIVRVDVRRGVFEPMTPLLSPDDVVKEWRARRRGNA